MKWLLSLLVALILVPSVLQALASNSAAYDVRVVDALRPPEPSHWLGTDGLGRDLGHRLLIAGAGSLSVAGQSLLIGLALSLVLGLIAGITERGVVDHAVLWVVGLLYTVPFFLIVVSLAGVVRPGLGWLPWLVGGVIWAPPARLVRGETIRVLRSRFVLAQRAQGFSPAFIAIRTLLPLVFAPAVVSLVYLVPEIVALDVALSFFGLGTQPPTPTLGRLILDGAREVQTAWWLATFPAAALVAGCLLLHAFNHRVARSLEHIHRA